ncbi:MAG: CRISPR-associated protein Cas4 [bacterium]|jgi:CRISPR-associated exonuclease Cas4
MFSEDELIPISTLQHYAFCPRRVGLVFIERLWGENVATLEGMQLHKKTERGKAEWVNGVWVTRSLPLRSLELGLVGVADVVEFHPRRSPPRGHSRAAPDLRQLNDEWTLLPVEYKRGRLRNEEGYILQLCAQAICLEEMLQTPIASGAIFFGRTKRRLDITFDTELRQKTIDTIELIRHLFQENRTPAAHYEKKCPFCSLFNICNPQLLKTERSIRLYLNSFMNDNVNEEQ